MTAAEPASLGSAAPAAERRTIWFGIGLWLLEHQSAIRTIQWGMVAVYLLMLVVPAALPLPDRTARIWNNAVLFSQFVFWGIWWPFVLVSTMLLGRVWCGLLCPEGALSEFASRRGRGLGIPRWIRWGGWPFVAFASTTIYGQMLSVYQYAGAALLILGGSTVAAVLVGATYGRGKRVWCRYLCPVSGVFAVLAKLAPLHFSVDEMAWRRSQQLPKPNFAQIDCAPLVPIRTMRGASLCHMCGRCNGFRGAVALAPRSPNHEIVHVAGASPNAWETALIVFGMLGIAAGAFHWPVSPWYVLVKQRLAEWLVGHGMLWPLDTTAPWWLLTNYPDHNDVLTILDGAVLIAYIGATATMLGLALCGLLALATCALGRWSWGRFHHLAQALIPLAGCCVFLGLSSLTVTLLRQDGLSLHWVDALRAALLVAASAWTIWLAAAISRKYACTPLRLGIAVLAAAGAAATGAVGPGLLFWIW